jgi:hypothetical protein
MDQNLVRQCPARRFYIYAFLRPDGTPYYIGKGAGNRINNTQSRRFKLPPKDQRKVLAGGLTEPEAFEYEIALISLLGRKDQGTGCLRNLTDGGEGISGAVHSPKVRAKISAAQSGRTRSPETRARMSAAQKGRTFSPEVLAKMSAAKAGRKLSPEHVAKMSATLTGHKHSPETRAKISAAKKGRKGPSPSPEHRAKQSAANKGRIFSPEHRARLSAAATARHAAKRALRETTSRQLALL